MTDDDSLFPEGSFTRDSEFEIPTVPGAIVVWDRLVESHGEALVGIGRKVLETADNSTELKYQFDVAAAFLDIQREASYVVDGIGKETGDERRLKDAMYEVAERHTVSRERVRQACTQPYSSDEKPMTELFLADLCELESRLEEWHAQNSE